MSELRTVREHSDRRLWHPDGQRYVTLGDVYEWLVDGVDLNVIDVDTHADMTCDVLFKVMAAQEQISAPAMSRDFLLQVIRTGARPSGGMVATFLEQSMKLFKTLQGDRKNRGSSAQKSPTQTAQQFAEANYQRWRVVQEQISRTLANARSCYPTAVVSRSEMIAPISGGAPAQRSRRSPRPPAGRARQ